MVGIAHFRGPWNQQTSITAPIATDLLRDVYIWQRGWTPGVVEALRQEAGMFRRFVVLSAEISFRDGSWKVAEVRPDYLGMGEAIHEIGLAIRIGPVGAAGAGAMEEDSTQTKLICATAVAEIDRAKAAGFEVKELQIDFDCAESKLAGYQNWVKAVKRAIAPVPLVITALPSWLKHREFGAVAREAGSYILQVHSLHKPAGPDADMNLCDADEARTAVAVAGSFGVPFRVALPTYSYLAAFSPGGKLLGLSAEGVMPTWPVGTLLRAMRSDPQSLAGLVREWSSARPPFMSGIIWYRLPVLQDTMNWRAATLNAVAVGRTPKAKVDIVVVHSKFGLLDIYLRNDGEADGVLGCDGVVDWSGAGLVAAEGIGGFERLDGPAGSVTFHAVDVPVGRWIAPGEQIEIGWLRLSADTEVHSHVSSLSPG